MSHRSTCPHCGKALDEPVAGASPPAAETAPAESPARAPVIATEDADLELRAFVTPSSAELPRVSGSDGEVAPATAAPIEPHTGPADSTPLGDGLVLLAPSRSGSAERTAVHADPRRRVSWAMFLLASYASALTLSMAWLIVTGRLRPTPAERRVSRATSEARESPTPTLPRLAADHLTDIGQPIRLGALEITPLSITLEPIWLRSAFDSFEMRDGGRDALILRLRLRNLGAKATLRPVEPAFLRQPDSGDSDSLIEADGSLIQMYPLALSSEWTLDGQDFRELRPGEEMDLKLVSEPDVSNRLAHRMTWRFRMRVEPGRTEVVGVRFGRSELSE
jgi:hypothetical protein